MHKDTTRGHIYLVRIHAQHQWNNVVHESAYGSHRAAQCHGQTILEAIRDGDPKWADHYTIDIQEVDLYLTD